MGTQINDTGAGYQIGGDSTEKLSFWGATPIVQPSGADQVALTEGTGAISGSNDGDFSLLITSGDVTDDDSAASNGTALYYHEEELQSYGIPTGHLESQTAGDANGTLTLSNGGATIRIRDDDFPGTGGFQVYFDEDARNSDERLLMNNTGSGLDGFVIGSDGRAIRIKHDASASTNGVALYFDDDAANSYERLLFVSPTDTAGTFTVDDTIGLINPVEFVRELATSVNAMRTALVNAGLYKGSA